MGVVKHTSNRRKYPTEGQHGILLSPGFTRTQATFEGWWADTSGTDGSEWGLTAIDDVVGPGGTALPRSAAGVEEATKLRDGVKAVVVYVSDEHSQEVENACPEIADQNKNLASGTEASRAQCIATTVAPFISGLEAEEVIAFGIIAPPPGGCSTSYEVGWGYAEVIGALGGSYGSVCASDPGQTLDDIVSAVAGAASSFQLDETPIAMTLKVVVTEASAPVCDPANPAPGRRELARSQVDGFDYDPVNNTIFFVGPNRPANGDTVTISYREWADQTANPNPDPVEPVCVPMDGACSPVAQCCGGYCQRDGSMAVCTAGDAACHCKPVG
jgi:hypothetical protein